MTGPDLRRRPSAAAALAVLALAAAGVGAGLVWALVVTPTRLTKAAGGLSLDEVSGATVFSATGWFCVVTAAVGLVVGVLAGLGLRRTRSPAAWYAVPVVAALAPALVALVAWQTGELAGRGPSAAAVAALADGSAVDAPLLLGTRTALAVGPLVAVAVVLVAAVWPARSGDPALGDVPVR